MATDDSRPTDKRRPGRDPHRKARVLLVDDHPIVREGLARVIDQEADLMVCGTAVNGREALQAVASAKPDIAVIDVSLEGSHGIDLVKELKGRHPELSVVMLSMHDETLYAERALRAGAKGYVMKREPPQKLLQAVRKVLQGGLFFSEAVTARMLQRVSRNPSREVRLPIERLSDRELEVLELIGRGRTTRQIANELHVSMKTIQAHREHLKEKLDLPDATSLVRFAVHWVESEGGSRPS
jgi:DNA-binding NarL/FixJ family response regulator